MRFELAREISTYSQSRLLEVGCGAGVLLAAAECTNMTVGVDTSRERLAASVATSPRSRSVCADMERLPFQPRVFDAVILAGVMEISSDRRRFLDDVMSLTRPGGRVLVATPNGEHWLYRDSSAMLSARELQEALAGWVDVHLGGYNATPSLLWFLPNSLLRSIPSRQAVYFYIPSRILGWVPGIRWILRSLMWSGRLVRRSKWLVATAEAPTPRQS